MPCASVTSEPQPQKGQSHRSSGNFSTEECSGNKLQWSCPPGISFDVMQDKSAAHDPTIFEGVTNGTVTDMYQARSLYVANPRHASANFEVSVTGVNA